MSATVNHCICLRTAMQNARTCCFTENECVRCIDKYQKWSQQMIITKMRGFCGRHDMRSLQSRLRLSWP